jgi:hypothetical protein
MSFIETNAGKDGKVLVKARYDRILLVPFIVLGALAIWAGSIIKKILPTLLVYFVGLPEKSWPDGLLNALGNVIFVIFLIGGVIYAVIMIIRTTGIELAATDTLLIGRYGNDAMCVPLDKIENFAIYKNIIGKIFKFGTITIGTPSTTLKIPFISDPEIFRDKVLELRDKKLS